MAGARETLDAVSLPPAEAIAFLRQKTNQGTEHWTDVWNEAHSRAFVVAGAASEALVEDFRHEVARALEEGTTLAEFRKSFDAIVTKHGWEHTGSAGFRASIIYETNLSMAYAAGRYAQMTDPEILAAYPYWRYQHNAAVHPREEHVAWSGLTLSADDPWWGTHYPPNGWRCHCSVDVVTERGLARMGKDRPDRAPALDLRPWRNPKTGEVVQVPHGIDPGFGYNAGQAWRQGEAGGRAASSRPAPSRPRLRAEAVSPEESPIKVDPRAFDGVDAGPRAPLPPAPAAPAPPEERGGHRIPAAPKDVSPLPRPAARPPAAPKDAAVPGLARAPEAAARPARPRRSAGAAERAEEPRVEAAPVAVPPAPGKEEARGALRRLPRSVRDLVARLLRRARPKPPHTPREG